MAIAAAVVSWTQKKPLSDFTTENPFKIRSPHHRTPPWEALRSSAEKETTGHTSPGGPVLPDTRQTDWHCETSDARSQVDTPHSSEDPDIRHASEEPLQICARPRKDAGQQWLPDSRICDEARLFPKNAHDCEMNLTRRGRDPKQNPQVRKRKDLHVVDVYFASIRNEFRIYSRLFAPL